MNAMTDEKRIWSRLSIDVPGRLEHPKAIVPFAASTFRVMGCG